MSNLRVLPRAAAPVIGIDLGTTHSLVAVLDGARPRCLPNVDGELLTASAVGIGDDGSVLVGAAARARAITHPALTATSFKRAMGTSQPVQLGAQSYSAVELSALVLAALKRDAEAALGAPVGRAVITVPAYFGEPQRQATRAAAELAGLEVARLVNEPTAAALAYCLDQRDRELTVAVLDLGGGTFDVTVLSLMEGVVEVRASAGDARLGGDDFTAALAEHLNAHHQLQGRPEFKREPAVWARVLEAAQQAKHQLGNGGSVPLSLTGLPSRLGYTQFEYELTQAQATLLWQPLLARLRTPIARALSDASLTPDAIDEVVLVGGATRMLPVRALTRELFGKEPLTSLAPDEAVALGAAVQAGLVARAAAVEDVVVTDVAPFTLGVATAEPYGGSVVSGIFDPIIDRGTVVPVSRAKEFSRIHPAQTSLKIIVYQGEHAMCADNNRLGELLIEGLGPPTPEADVELRFSYDPSGVIEVDATLRRTGKRHQLVLQDTPGRLSPEALTRARERLARLKLHPRDALPNATALARGDALYVELVGQTRNELGHLLSAFRAALAAQDAAAIEHLRAVLNDVVARGRKRGSS